VTTDPDYTQCRLQRDEVREGQLRTRVQTAWIPTKFAVVGEVIQLRCPPGLWINGWEVMEVYDADGDTLSIERARRRFAKRVG